MIQVTENVLQFRGRLVSSYALLPNEDSEDGITLIDGGFLTWTPERVLTQLETLGWKPSDVRAVLLTHGHIDHTKNLARWQQLTEAKIYAPKADHRHIAGTFPYRGLSRFCGMMESVARMLFRYQSPTIDHWYDPGEHLSLWGGLEVISLSGHTAGHSGFYSEKRKLLIAGDLFSNFWHRVKPPPPWFNVDSSQIRKSICEACTLDLTGGVLLNHCRSGPPADHREDLLALKNRISGL